MSEAANPQPPKRGRARRESGAFVELRADDGSSNRHSKVYTFGSARQKAPAKSADAPRSIGLGQAAMKKLKTRLMKPGVKLRTSKSTPLFRADPANPRQVIRMLNGREDSGVFEEGVFKVRG